MLNRKSSVIAGFGAIAVMGVTISACTTDGSTAGASAKSGGQCFLASNVNSFNGNSDGTVDIQVGANQYFRLTTDGTCPDIDWKTRIGIQTTSGGDFVCNGYDARFVVPDSVMGPERCNITAIAPLTKEQYLEARKK